MKNTNIIHRRFPPSQITKKKEQNISFKQDEEVMSSSRHLVLPIERRKQMSYEPCATVVSIVPPSGWIENKRLLVTVAWPDRLTPSQRS